MLKNDFEDLLRDYGHHVLVARQSKQLRCSCWNEKNQEASRDCPSCFGLGRVPVIEKHTTRNQVHTIPESLPRAISDAPFGQILTEGKSYYFRADSGIQEKDLIVEVDWSSTGKPIYNGGDILEVNLVDTKRFEHGNLTYLKVYAKDEPVTKGIRGVRIANTNGIKNYELIRE